MASAATLLFLMLLPLNSASSCSSIASLAGKLSLNSISSARILAATQDAAVVYCAHQALTFSNKLGIGVSFGVDEDTRTCVVVRGEVKEEDLSRSSDSGSSRAYVIRGPTGEAM